MPQAFYREIVVVRSFSVVGSQLEPKILISNATKHNINDGKIKITLSEKLLAITNTSHTAALNQQTLFQRFAKESNGNENNSLGLSIIKQICDTSGFVVQYEFTNEMHVFMIRWK